MRSGKPEVKISFARMWKEFFKNGLLTLYVVTNHLDILLR
jgi:hypothetical protein